jgi:hypothetical protein
MSETSGPREGTTRLHPQELMNRHVFEDADQGILRIQVGSETEACRAIKLMKKRRQRFQDQVELRSEAVDEIERKFPTREAG